MYRIIFLQPTDVKGLDPILYPKTDSKTLLFSLYPSRNTSWKKVWMCLTTCSVSSWRTHSLNFARVAFPTAREAFPNNMLPTTPGPLHMLYHSLTELHSSFSLLASHTNTSELSSVFPSRTPCYSCLFFSSAHPGNSFYNLCGILISAHFPN